METAFERGWAQLANGELIEEAEAAGFELYITTDKNLRYQQNLIGRRIAIVVLWTTNWPLIKPHASTVATIALALRPGEFSDPGIIGGTPVFVATRVPVQTLLDYLEAGDPLDEFLENFPGVSRQQAVAVLELAKEMLLARAATA